jgi:hypothetical protein
MADPQNNKQTVLAYCNMAFKLSPRPIRRTGSVRARLQ